MNKQLTRLTELQDPVFVKCMEEINLIAHKGSLKEYTTYSRVWEYPWIWLQLKALKGKKLRVLDIGSETSPLIWYLAVQGFDVIISDITARYWQEWKKAKKLLGVNVNRVILDAQDLDLPTSSVDIYLSVSVIEHMPQKLKSIEEAARVLKPNGLLIITFDICEQDMGMTFPEWNGQAVTMKGFDKLFKESPWFEPGLSELPWNIESIPDYLSWNRKTAPHHNYVTGAAIVKRNSRVWVEAKRKDISRTLRGKIRTVSSVTNWYLKHNFKDVQKRLFDIKRAMT